MTMKPILKYILLSAATLITCGVISKIYLHGFFCPRAMLAGIISLMLSLAGDLSARNIKGIAGIVMRNAGYSLSLTAIHYLDVFGFNQYSDVVDGVTILVLSALSLFATFSIRGLVLPLVRTVKSRIIGYSIVTVLSLAILSPFLFTIYTQNSYGETYEISDEVTIVLRKNPDVPS